VGWNTLVPFAVLGLLGFAGWGLIRFVPGRHWALEWSGPKRLITQIPESTEDMERKCKSVVTLLCMCNLRLAGCG
jgi:hypothetical protein